MWTVMVRATWAGIVRYCPLTCVSESRLAASGVTTEDMDTSCFTLQIGNCEATLACSRCHGEVFFLRFLSQFLATLVLGHMFLPESNDRPTSIVRGY